MTIKVTMRRPSKVIHESNRYFENSKRYYENGDITTVVEDVFVGYGLNAQSVFGRYVSTFSIASGIIRDKEYKAPKCWYR